MRQLSSPVHPGSFPGESAPTVPLPAVGQRAQHGRPGARSRRTVLLAAVATALVLAAAAIVFRPWAEPGHVVPRDVDFAMPLPWPNEGQSAAEVIGVGSLGTVGERDPVPIASLTKVMTAYVVLRDHPIGENQSGPAIRVDQQAQDESYDRDQSSAPVRAGQLLTERDLLGLMLVPSGNNIARLLARWDAGSQEAFVRRMNATAHDLGMTSTTYTGASGVEDSTVSTADDQLILARQAVGTPVIRAICGIRTLRVPGVPTVTNTNTLLGMFGVIGLKTGSSTAAGGALMWAAQAPTPGGVRLVVGVVLHQAPGGSPNSGLAAALDRSSTLINAIGQGLAAPTQPTH